ncbi:MAG: hypothetical protein DMG26_11780 [Acidobacteria bacterium]|nr:MAG: hypothetical protein DMG26_11780 [Acidobacteriota bacterium]
MKRTGAEIGGAGADFRDRAGARSRAIEMPPTANAVITSAGATLGAGVIRPDLLLNESPSSAGLNLYYIPDSPAASIAVGDWVLSSFKASG